MTGIEYEIGKCQPPRLFIIHKQNRNSPDSGIKNFIYINFINIHLSIS